MSDANLYAFLDEISILIFGIFFFSSWVVCVGHIEMHEPFKSFGVEFLVTVFLCEYFFPL